MALHIDTSNVTLMSEFKDAIEKYVQEYVSVVSYGVHENQQLKAEASESSGNSTFKETIAVSININAPNTMHWGMLNALMKQIHYLKLFFGGTIMSLNIEYHTILYLLVTVMQPIQILFNI